MEKDPLRTLSLLTTVLKLQLLKSHSLVAQRRHGRQTPQPVSREQRPRPARVFAGAAPVDTNPGMYFAG